MAENLQYQQRINKLEHMLKNASDTDTDDLPARLSSLQAAYNRLLAEREGLLEDNAKLIQHHNAKQKLHYHVKIKEENNRLRAEIQTLQAELAKHIQ